MASAAIITAPANDLALPSVATLAPGLHRDVPGAVYYQRELGVASKSALDKVLRAPAFYRAWIAGAEEETTDALEFGTAFHTATLEPERFAREYAVEPDFGDCRANKKTGTTKEQGAANKARRDAWREDHKDALFLEPAQHARIEGMVRALRAHRAAARMLDEGLRELTVRWDDAPTGIPCKGRVDLWFPKLRAIVDLKSCEDASLRGFQRHVANYGYHRQDAMYRAGFDAVGERVEHFMFVCVEKAPPHLVALYVLDASAVERGARTNRRLLETLAGCLATDKWPGLPEGVQELSLPRWFDQD